MYIEDIVLKIINMEVKNGSTIHSILRNATRKCKRRLKGKRLDTWVNRKFHIKLIQFFCKLGLGQQIQKIFKILLQKKFKRHNNSKLCLFTIMIAFIHVKNCFSRHIACIWRISTILIYSDNKQVHCYNHKYYYLKKQI